MGICFGPLFRQGRSEHVRDEPGADGSDTQVGGRDRPEGVWGGVGPAQWAPAAGRCHSLGAGPQDIRHRVATTAVPAVVSQPVVVKGPSLLSSRAACLFSMSTKARLFQNKASNVMLPWMCSMHKSACTGLVSHPRIPQKICVLCFVIVLFLSFHNTELAFNIQVILKL